MNKDSLNAVLKDHKTWLNSNYNQGKRANFYKIDLSGADLTDVNLTGADLTGADLTFANLTGADLTGADLTGANLKYVKLIGAKLTGVNLTGADLTGANLENVDIRECVGNMRHIKSIFSEHYIVNYTSNIIQIGHNQHPINEWWNFDDNHILEMEGTTMLNWWRKWKTNLKQIIEESPAIPTYLKLYNK